jgi:hypothetical protein
MGLNDFEYRAPEPKHWIWTPKSVWSCDSIDVEFYMNQVIRVKITLVRVEITLVRVEVTIVSVVLPLL